MPSLSNASKNRSLAGNSKSGPLKLSVARRTRIASIVRTVGLVASAGWKWGRSAAGVSFGGGCVAGLYLVGFCHPLTARFGAGLTFAAGALPAAIVGMLIGAIGRRRAEGARPQSSVICLALAAWAIAFDWLADTAGLIYGSISLAGLASPWVQVAAAFGVSLALVGFPVACAVRLTFGASTARVGWLLCGAAMGLLLATQIVGPTCGMQWTLWIAATCSLAILASRRRQTVQVANPARRGGFNLAAVVWPVVASVVAGMAAAGLSRLTLQLFPSAEALEWTGWTGFLLGTAAGWVLSRRQVASRRPETAARVVLIGALCLALSVVCFGILTDWSLAATASVSQVVLLMLIRGTFGACLSFPLGAAWTAVIGLDYRETNRNSESDEQSFEEGQDWPGLLARSIAALLVGYLAAEWLVTRGMNVPTLIGSAAILYAAGGTWLASRGTPWTRRWPSGVAFAVIVALAAVGRLGGFYSPARAARLLFSTDVFMERHDGTETRLLPFLDDGRLVASEEGNRGTYTLWKRHGVQYEVRENGIPLGTYCNQAELCPQYSGQVLTAALPLTLHESPRRVLILGLGSGSTLLASLEFPVAEVICVEADGRLVDLLARDVWPCGTSNPRGDNRVKIVEVDPACAVKSRPGSFDVIVSDTDPAGVAMGTPYFTREFYAGVNRQLGVDGIYAQRFRYVDFGPWPVSSVLATLQSVFAEVAAIEAGGGDLVLLATNSPRGLNRPDLFKRFQAPQSARTLSHVGWDWSVALNLGAYRGEGCDAIARGAKINTASNGLFAYGLPQETMRWGPKRDELAQVLNAHAGRIAEWPNVEGNDPEFLRRLNDVLMQRELMTAYPDQPWAYRKSVHEELKKHPHTVIAEAGDGFDRQLHPVDRHRLDYFAALGKAAQARRPTLESLRELEEFAEPYDPVLTYFVHHELSSLYARAGSVDPAAQLRHRLYTVYYGDARDRSIRDVVEALQLLAVDQQALPAPERWDHMNALLQFLKLRWNNRGLGKPPSVRIVLNDLDRTIGAAESTFSEMDKLWSVVGVPEADWKARREVIDRALVRPLRAYQAELVPAYLKEIAPPVAAAKQPPASTKQNAN